MAKRSSREMTPEQREHERAYQREYYRKWKEQLSESKRIQREQTPGVKEAYQLRSKRHHAEKTRPVVIERRARALGTAAQLSELAPKGRAVVVATGKSHDFFNLAALGLLLNKSPDTLLDWERRVVLPAPLWSQRDLDRTLSKGGNPRLYSRAEMEVYERCRDLLVIATKALGGSAFATQAALGLSKLRLAETVTPS